MRIKYTHINHNVPVEVEVEGEEFSPGEISSNLARVLLSLKSRMSTYAPKDNDEVGSVHFGGCSSQGAALPRRHNDGETRSSYGARQATSQEEASSHTLRGE